jgi:hypothetical protein
MTLHLFARFVVDLSKKNAFDALGAFDGTVGLGHKKLINLMRIRNALEMGSRQGDNPASERQVHASFPGIAASR